MASDDDSSSGTSSRPTSPLPTPVPSEMPCTPQRKTPLNTLRRVSAPLILFPVGEMLSFHSDDGTLRAKRKLRDRLVMTEGAPFSYQERLKSQRQEDPSPTHEEEDFDLGREIGRGSFGTVYQVCHKETGNLHAMKILTRHIPNMRAARCGIMREHQILLSLRDKAFVLQGHGFGLSDNSAFLLTEFCNGGSLDGVLASHKADVSFFSESALMRILHHTASGLFAIHNAEIVHSDIKPANIFIQQTPTGPVYKIGDLGHAVRYADCARSLEPGDAKYMAREILGECKDPSKIDIFSLGITLLETATLLSPPSNSTPEWLELRTRGPEKISAYTDFFNNILQWMLQADPESRPTALNVRDAAIQTRSSPCFERAAA